tara:strand:- start:712 stop:1779 length:1068 start_codon:yes stop_codon:yes gene_type:complete
MKKKSLNVKKKVHKKLLSYLKNNKINKNYRQFLKNINSVSNNNKFTAAISGGPDSLALAFFLKCYSLKTNKKCTFLIINHNLREGSNDEAIKVQKKLKDYDINLKIINWFGKKPKSNIQAIARKHRYRLIRNQLEKNKTNVVMFGHTNEDLIENFVIRLTRGSSIDGLVSFNQTVLNTNEFFKISRPLINLNKKDLIYVSKKVFNFYINDPSNLNISFKRVRIRKLINDLSTEGLDLNKINLLIKNLSISNNALTYYLNQTILNFCHFKNNNKLAIVNLSILSEPKEILFRFFSKILKIISGNYYSARGKKIMNLIKELEDPKFNKATLSGCILEKECNSLIIKAEKSKKLTKYV